jgi:hypothetical protein
MVLTLDLFWPKYHMISMEERINQASTLSTTLSTCRIESSIGLLLKIDDDMHSFGAQTFQCRLHFNGALIGSRTGTVHPIVDF